MKTRALVVSLAALAALVGCRPSPDTFSLTSKTTQIISGTSGARTTSMVEGDVLVLDATPLDGDQKAMSLCVTATSSNAGAVEVRRVEGQCRSFVVSAKASGNASVVFSARDGEESLAVTVAPLPLP